MPPDPSKVAELQALAASGARIQVCEYIRVQWSDALTEYYGSAAWHELAPFEDIGVTVKPRLIPKGKNDPLHELELNPDLRTDNINLTFDDIDKEISGRFREYKSGIECEVYAYFPQATDGLTVSLWFGQLQAPQVYGWKTLKTVATNGYRSRESLIGSRKKPLECSAHVFGGLLPDADAVRSNLCPYDRHLGGSVGLYKTGTTPFSDCPKLSESDCIARFGHARFFGGFVVDNSAVQTFADNNYIAVSKGNRSALNEPVRWIFGNKFVRSSQMLLKRQNSPSGPNTGFIAGVWEIGEGPVSDIYNFTVNDLRIGFQHINILKGTRGQAPSSYSSVVSNYSSTAHVYAVYGPINPGDYPNPSDLATTCNVLGFNEVCVYTDDDPVTKTRQYSTDRVWCLLEVYRNQKAGLGYAEARFTIGEWMTASDWGQTTVTHTVTFPDGESVQSTSQRTTFNAILEGRPVAEHVEDICRAGAISVPFQNEGKFTLRPFRVATEDELDNAKVFSDRGSGVNIIWDNIPVIELSQTPDNKLPNMIEITFEESANFDTERSIKVDDPNQKLLAGRQLGPDYSLTVEKRYAGFGISTLAEARRLGYRILKFGEFDEGGTDNNLRAKITVPFEQVLGLVRYDIIKIESDLLEGFLSPTDEQFEYFRILNMRKVGNGRCEITAQAYNVSAYEAFETEIVAPGGVVACRVQGCGIPSINGTYLYWQDTNGKPSYRKGPYSIYWDSAAWICGTLEEYTSSDDTDFPWEATFVTGATGEEPPPVVSELDTPYPALPQVEAATLGTLAYDDATGQLTIPIV